MVRLPAQFGGGRSSASVKPLKSKVAEIGKNVAAVCQYVEIEQAKKATKKRRKLEKKEAATRAEAERAETKLKKKKREEKARKVAEQNEEIRKCLDIKMAVRVEELREDVREDVRQEIQDPISELCVVVAGSKQKTTEEPASESGASSSETEELNLRTETLCLIDKRKHGSEPVFEGSTPMELSPKRTPRRAAKSRPSRRVTRSRSRADKTPTPKKTSPSIQKKTPAPLGMVGRLRFEKRVMNELKNLDALVLQNICKDEGIAYNGKFECISTLQHTAREPRTGSMKRRKLRQLGKLARRAPLRERRSTILSDVASVLLTCEESWVA
ncbi:hypothetical protein CBR_g23878 [Chara braunii]|uniref:Uncharacterized protein n=1 Tax=Chara braunii TaxID=69332 RepID=A0A388L529_CHABU|nr:hypothetical protein CBR_g23878 [Chara braunii]|eukprot:GBG77429.1 hypothetical protein CBR_g23878 [Chara braunii]